LVTPSHQVTSKVCIKDIADDINRLGNHDGLKIVGVREEILGELDEIGNILAVFVFKN
jgi:hypothetical protein